MYCVIMAGGSGTRFWPLSRHAKPKQLLNIVGKTTMLQMTVDRLRKVSAVKDIFIATREDLAETICKDVRGVKPENIIVEPSGKNTAPCIGLSALHIERLKKDAVMGVFPSDHLIVGHRKFARAVNTANHLARKNNSIVTIGIPPTYPSTAYGYIQFDLKSDEDHINAYRLKTFAEKPHLSLAKRFLKSGDFLWNAGMFIWKVDTLNKQLEFHMPELHEQLLDIGKRIENKQSFTDIWSAVKPKSIDYGLMEKVVKDTYVVMADFAWNDLGSWDAVYDVSPKNSEGNVVKGDGLVLDGSNNLIQSNGRFTAIMGLNDLVVVNTDDATLVISKAQVEEVKNLVDVLKKKKRLELL